VSLLPRREDMFWADATAPDGFVLDGMRYDGQAVANGAKVAQGDKVLVARTTHGLTPGRRRGMVILQSSHGATRRGRSRPFFSLTGLGIWIQAEGTAYLSQSGLAPVNFPTGPDVIFDLSGSASEEYGMDRLLGIAHHNGTFFIATYVENATLDGYEKLRFRAYSLVTADVTWTADFELSPALTPETQKFYRANLFLDVPNKVITAAHERIWSLQLDDAFAPVGDVVQTEMDGRLAASIVGDKGLIPSFDYAAKWRVISRNSSTLEWSVTEDNLDVNANLGGLSDFPLNRPWPYYPSDTSWRLLHDPHTLTPQLALITRLGALTSNAITITDDLIELTSLLDAAETQFSTEGTTGGLPYPYQEPTWDDPPGSGDFPNFDHVAWVGRSTPAVDPNTPTVFVCPRRGGGVTRYFRWVDMDIGGTGECLPGLRATSTGKTVYAAIEPIRYLTSGTKITNNLVSTSTIPAYEAIGKDSDHNTIQRWFITPPELVSFEEASENGGWYGVGEAEDVTLLNYEDSHQPKLVHGHRTMLRSLNANGSTNWERDLSSGPFVGIQAFLSTVMTEELPWPENVHDIKIGPKGTGFDYEDAIFVAQDRRETRDVPASRPCFRFLSAAGAIRSTVMCSPGSTIEPSIVETEQTYTATEDNQAYFALDSHPAQAVLRFYVNDVEADISDEGANYFSTPELEWHSGVPCVEGDEIRIVYTYLENPDVAGQYEWTVSDVALAVNIGAGSNQKWALLGVYSDHVIDLDSRTDMYVLDLSDPDNVVIQATLTEINGTDYPRKNDFDRFTFTPDGIYWIGNLGGGYSWIKFTT